MKIDCLSYIGFARRATIKRTAVQNFGEVLKVYTLINYD